MSAHSEPLVHTGRVWVFGDNINTDLIMPNTAFRLPRAEQHTLCFEANRPGWTAMTHPGDVIVSGENFGMGSSRPVGVILRACGIAGVVAGSVNGLCLRNCINSGLPAMDCPGVRDAFEDGDEIRVDFTTGSVENLTRGVALTGKPLAPLLAGIVRAGGVIPMLVAEGLIESEPFAAVST